MKKIIGITMGDPAGVGPEICLKAIRHSNVRKTCTPVLFGDADILKRIGKLLNQPLPQSIITLNEWNNGHHPRETTIVHCEALDAGKVKPGMIQPACGMASALYIGTAIKAAKAKRINAMVTAPVHKKSMNLAGIPYPGHTEMLACMTHTQSACMMLTSEKITVSLVTVHCAVKDVPRQLTRERILKTIELTWQAMKKLGKRSPRLIVCGLNPHSGEHGLFGVEEKNIIEPAIATAKKRSIRIEGPIPADTAFIPSKLKSTDAYIVMYHDQGLIPFKMLAFDTGVNVTLGLPIVRTSVDHGTAFDIAWKGKASANSLIEAIYMADKLS